MGAAARHRPRLGRLQCDLRSGGRLRAGLPHGPWHDAERGRLLASVIGFSILPLQPFGGALAERSGRPMLVTVLCVIGMVLCLAGVSLGGRPGCFCRCSAWSPQHPRASSSSLQGRSSRRRPAPSAWVCSIRCSTLGLAALPPLAGLARDVTGSAAAPLQVASAVLVLTMSGLWVYAAKSQSKIA